MIESFCVKIYQLISCPVYQNITRLFTIITCYMITAFIQVWWGWQLWLNEKLQPPCIEVVCNTWFIKSIPTQTLYCPNNCPSFSTTSNLTRLNFQVDCLHELRGLSSLTIQNICTNEMLSAVAQTCSRLQESLKFLI